MKTGRLYLPVTIIAIIWVLGCGLSRQPFDPDNENVRYAHFTCWPDNCRFIIDIEFKGDTPNFHDERIAKIHETLTYSINRLKVKTVTVKVEKYGWQTYEKTWEGEVPYDIFIKLETLP